MTSTVLPRKPSAQDRLNRRMSPSRLKHPVRGADLSSLPEELLERILDEYISSTLAIQAPGSTYATSPYPSPISPTSSGQGSLPFKHSPSRVRVYPPSPSHRQPPPNTTSPGQADAVPVSVVTPLLVSPLFHRISSPLLYRFITLSSRSRTRKLLHGSLRHHPERACWIRRLIIAGVWEEGGEILKLIAANATLNRSVPRVGKGLARLATPPSISAKGKARQVVLDGQPEGWRVSGLEVLEITIDVAPLNLQQRPGARSAGSTNSILGHADRVLSSSAPSDGDADAMSEGLTSLAQRGGILGLKELVLRKPQNVYLTHRRTKMVLGALASVVEAAPALETVHIAFRLSDDPVSRTSPGAAQRTHADHGPVAALTGALSLSRCLHTLTTHLPSVWNEALLRMSSNPALERIVLLGAGGMAVTFAQGSAIPSPRSSIHAMTNARALPSHPVERVYTTSARGCDGYAIANSNGSSPPHGMRGVPGTGIFMNEARKHDHLCALVHAGYLAQTHQPSASPLAVPCVINSPAANAHARSPIAPLVYTDPNPRCIISRGPLSLSSLS